MADPPHSTTSHPLTLHPQKRQGSQCIEEGSQKSTRSDLSDDVEMETSTPMFQPAEFGSFHSAQQVYEISTPQHDHITHKVLLGELTRMYDALAQKIVMENGALLAALRAENKNIKQELEEMRNEIHSTYLAQRIPEKLPDLGSLRNSVLGTGQEEATQKPNRLSPENASIPARPKFYAFTQQKLSMASIAATGAPTTKITAEWIMVNNKKGEKKTATKNKLPIPLKSVEEAKRRIIFLRSPEAPKVTGNTAQEILYSVNMKLLSLKLPAHLRLVMLSYNERGNLTGLTTGQINAEIMVTKCRNIIT